MKFLFTPKSLNNIFLLNIFFPFVFLADQLLHVDILDMAAAYKFEVHRYRLANEKETDVNDEEVTVSIMADLQDEQDKESEGILAQLQDKVTEHELLREENAQHIVKSSRLHVIRFSLI